MSNGESWDLEINVAVDGTRITATCKRTRSASDWMYDDKRVAVELDDSQLSQQIKEALRFLDLKPSS